MPRPNESRTPPARRSRLQVIDDSRLCSLAVSRFASRVAKRLPGLGRSGPAVVLPGGARPTDQDDSAPPGTSDNGFWDSYPSGRC